MDDVDVVLSHAIHGCRCHVSPWSENDFLYSLSFMVGHRLHHYCLPYCRSDDFDFGQKIDSICKVISAETGLRFVEQTKAIDLCRFYYDESQIWLSFGSRVSKLLSEVRPVVHSGSGREALYLLQDIVRLFPPSKRVRCMGCGRRLSSYHEWQNEISMYSMLHRCNRDQCIRPHVVKVKSETGYFCRPACFKASQWLATQREEMQCEAREKRKQLDAQRAERKREMEQLSNCRKQLAALRRFKTTGNLEVFKSLPEGFGPAASSPT